MSKPSPTTETSEEELKRIAELGIALLNTRDFFGASADCREHKPHIAPDFVAQFDAHDRLLTLHELQTHFQKWYAEHPAFHCKHKHLTTLVHEKSGTGLVHYEIELIFENMCQEGLGQMRFKRDARGVWMMHLYVGMRGIPGMGGFV